jgi:hypothetical protein
VKLNLSFGSKVLECEKNVPKPQPKDLKWKEIGLKLTLKEPQI